MLGKGRAEVVEMAVDIVRSGRRQHVNTVSARKRAMKSRQNAARLERVMSVGDDFITNARNVGQQTPDRPADLQMVLPAQRRDQLRRADRPFFETRRDEFNSVIDPGRDGGMQPL